MRPRLLTILLLDISLILCVELDKYYTSIDDKTKIELPPILIECKLNDIVIVKAPEVTEKHGLYYLYKPNGEVIKLNIPNHRHNETDKNNAKDENVINKDNYISKNINSQKYRIFNVNQHQVNTTHNSFEEYFKKMNDLEFIVGPLSEDDHGNWVLSVFYTDINGDTVELFQVISIEINDNVPPHRSHITLINGNNFKLRFAYPVKYLESCELRPPSSTSDRFYDRDSSVKDYCGYIVPNVTHEDTGDWTIVGVGKIVHKTKVYLNVYSKFF